MIARTAELPGLLAFIGGLGPWEVPVILVVVLLLFGARRLPEMARGLGKGIRTFRQELKGVQTEISSEVDDDALDAVHTEVTGKVEDGAKESGPKKLEKNKS